jgi:hypothetical protein
MDDDRVSSVAKAHANLVFKGAVAAFHSGNRSIKWTHKLMKDFVWRWVVYISLDVGVTTRTRLVLSGPPKLQRH